MRLLPTICLPKRLRNRAAQFGRKVYGRVPLAGFGLRALKGRQEIGLCGGVRKLEHMPQTDLNGCCFALKQLRGHHVGIGGLGTVGPVLPILPEGFDVRS